MGLEAEAGFHQGAELIGPAFTPLGIVQVEDRRGHGDGIAQLPLVPPLPGPHSGFLQGAIAGGGGKAGLPQAHAKAVALDQNIAPLQPHRPRLTGSQIAARAAVDAIARADRGQPAACRRLPETANGKGVGVHALISYLGGNEGGGTGHTYACLDIGIEGGKAPVLLAVAQLNGAGAGGTTGEKPRTGIGGVGGHVISTHTPAAVLPPEAKTGT